MNRFVLAGGLLATCLWSTAIYAAEPSQAPAPAAPGFMQAAPTGAAKEDIQKKLMQMRQQNLKQNAVPVTPPPVRLPKAESAAPAVAGEGTERKSGSSADLSTTVKPRLPASAPSPMPSASKEGIPEEIAKFKQVVSDAKKQVIQADKREFASLSRNYVNRISCSGQIEKMIVPQDQGLEAEITNDNHDLFIRVGVNPSKQFPVDLSLICDGQVFLINAVVHPHVPSQEIVLELPKGIRPLSTVAKEKHAESIAAAEALPLEEKLSKIMQRMYKGDFLAYWREIDTPTSQSRWNNGSYAVLLQKVVKTEIDHMIAWDFVFRGRFPTSSFYDVIRKIVTGEVVAFGRVAYEGHDAARIIVITRERAGSGERASK